MLTLIKEKKKEKQKMKEETDTLQANMRDANYS